METREAISYKASFASKARSILSKIFVNQYSFLIIFMVVLGIIVTIINPNFIKVTNLFNIILQVSVTGVVCAGIGTVILSGEFDISLGSQMSVIAVVFAMTISQTGNIPLAILIAFILGIVMGAINGIIVVKSNAHSFILTMGTSTAYAGVALFYSSGLWASLKGKFQFIGRYKVFNLIPMPAIVFVAVIIVLYMILRFTKFGRIIYAIGGNVEAAYLSGINVKLYKISIFIFASVFYAIATIVLISQLGAGYPNTGNYYTLPAIASVIVGGIAITGGRGSAISIFLGALVFGVINNSLNMLMVNPYIKDIILGAIVLIAVTFSAWRSRKL